MTYIKQDANYNYYSDIINNQVLIKARYDPYIGCNSLIIKAVESKLNNQVKIQAISEQVGISKYKVNKIINLLEHGRPNDEVLFIRSLPIFIEEIF